MSTEFNLWLEGLDGKGRVIVEERLSRIRLHDHYGDVKILSLPLAELRWKNGLRVYFIFLESHRAILLLLGGNKNSQRKDIVRSKRILKDFYEKKV
jgi:putative addiction module killer protein